MNNKIIIFSIVALLIGGGVGFFGGMQYQKNQLPTGNFRTGGNAGARRFGNGANGSVIRGQVISKDNNSITIKLQDGSTKIVIVGSSAMIAKSTLGTADDIANGNNVTVFGTANSDGTVTAQNVQVGNLGMFGPRGSGTPSATPASGY